MDTYADDLAALVETLDLKDAIHVGHSTGGGEVARYIGRHGTKRVAKAVLISAVAPLMLKTHANPGGLPIEVFDQFARACSPIARSSSKTSQCRFTATTPGAKVSEGVRESFWLQGMMAGIPAAYFCIKAVLRNGLDGRSQAVRCPDADPAWRRRSNRADRRFGAVRASRSSRAQS